VERRTDARNVLGKRLSATGVYLSLVELIETSIFTRQITALLTDEEYRRFQV
jgi:hypothetical protein